MALFVERPLFGWLTRLARYSPLPFSTKFENHPSSPPNNYGLNATPSNARTRKKLLDNVADLRQMNTTEMSLADQRDYLDWLENQPKV